jgi:hypothetical protein
LLAAHDESAASETRHLCFVLVVAALHKEPVGGADGIDAAVGFAEQALDVLGDGA